MVSKDTSTNSSLKVYFLPCTFDFLPVSAFGGVAGRGGVQCGSAVRR